MPRVTAGSSTSPAAIRASSAQAVCEAVEEPASKAGSIL